MDLHKKLLELKSQGIYLASLSREDVIHVIKSSIYDIENLNVFNEKELKEINKVVLIGEPFNNLYFKYNKEQLLTKGVVYMFEEDDLTFITSLFYYFKLRIPVLFNTNSKIQQQSFDIFLKFLKENNISENFLRKIDE